MPDLGKYAFEVLTAYGVSLALLGLLVWWTLAQGAKMRNALRNYEAERLTATTPSPPKDAAE